MKEQFPEYYQPSGADFAKLWNEATFVVDANVLLNLYRYPQAARDELIKAFERVKGRLWVSHQAALEFHRNRLAVIAEQKQRFSQVHAVLQNIIPSFERELEALQVHTRHSLIDYTGLVGSIRSSIEKYLDELNRLEKKQQTVNDADKILHKIQSLFSDKVGPRPTQTALDEIFQEGERRYQFKIPPGFADEKKEDYAHDGLYYKGKFGDLVLWKQTIEFLKSKENSCAILLTDDRKADWWYSVKGMTIGPHPELIAEFRRESGAKGFHIYNSENFLKYSKEFLGANVSEIVIGQVNQVINERELLELHTDLDMDAAAMRWVSGKFPDFHLDKVSLSRGSRLRLVSFSGNIVGLKIVYLMRRRNFVEKFMEAVNAAHEDMINFGYKSYEIFVFTDENIDIAMLQNNIRLMLNSIKVTFCYVKYDSQSGFNFVPILEYRS